jgi:hypothetical protein
MEKLRVAGNKLGPVMQPYKAKSGKHSILEKKIAQVYSHIQELPFNHNLF